MEDPKTAGNSLHPEMSRVADPQVKVDSEEVCSTFRSIRYLQYPADDMQNR